MVGITIFAHEDMPQTTCYYDKKQAKEIIKMLKENGTDYESFVVEK